MIGLLQRVLRGGWSAPVDYEESKRLAASRDPADRRDIAERTGARPEVLYYLASDPDPSVRIAVASNEASPVQADLILAADADEAVRRDLARKIGELAPGLTAGETDRLRRLTYEVLERLVQDQAVKVRQILAEALKDKADAAPEIMRRLARDCEDVVAMPVLQYSPVLTDDDLLDILRTLPSPSAARAIAGREHLGSRVSHAIGQGFEDEVVATLLSNSSAQIREETLDMLVAHAPAVRSWHRPLVMRPVLSSNAVLKLARFVATNLLDRLRDRRDLDPETMRQVSDVVMRRLEQEAPTAVTAAAPKLPPKGDGPTADELALVEVRKLAAAGKLDERRVLDGLASNDRFFVRAALVQRAGLSFAVVDKVLSSQSPKGVTALAWKARLGMRTAVKLQTILAHIPPASILKPTATDGFPLNAEALAWQLDFFSQMVAESGARP
ncbi:MAG TPA: DUF2336 domain-containing protein [Stellaceae bacterium]|nr:DUF2336 domain-containing protein [Stellaceae bacterium]